MPKLASRVARLVAYLFAFSLPATRLCAQVAGVMRPPVDTSCTTLPVDKAPPRPRYELTALPADDVTLMRAYLKKSCWRQALRIVTKQYQPGLPAWMVYIDSAGKVNQGFISEGDTTSIIRNQHNIWAMVFMDRRMELMRATKTARDAQSTARVAALKMKTDSVARAGQLVASTGETAKRLREKADAAVKDDAQAASDLQAAQRHDETPRDRRRIREARAKAKAAHAAAVDALAKASDAKTAATKAQNDLEGAQLAVVKAEAVVRDSEAAPEVSDTVDLSFARRTLIYQVDPTLISLLKSVAKTVSITTPDAPKLDDSVKVVSLTQMSADSESTTMWMGFRRFSLVENAVVELALTPVRPKQFPVDPTGKHENLQRIYANLANVREHTFELGVLGGFTYGAHVATYDPATLRITSVSSQSMFGAYVTAIVNVPDSWFSVGLGPDWRRAVLGGFIGTNVLSGTVGDQFVAGAAFGHLIADAGVDVGTAWVPVSEIRNGLLTSRRRPRLLLGLDLRL